MEMRKTEAGLVFVVGAAAFGRRLIVRRVDEMALAEKALSTALARHDLYVTVAHGGSVANNYGYPAETEGALAIATPNLCVVYVNRLPANKVTEAGVSERCIPGARPLFDLRFGKGPQREGALALVRHKLEETVSRHPLTSIAAMG
jgi:hypothetical protein